MEKISEIIEFNTRAESKISIPEEELAEIFDLEEILKILENLLDKGEEDEEEEERESYVIELLKKYGKAIEKYFKTLAPEDPKKMEWLNELKKTYADEWIMSSMIVNEQSYKPESEARLEYQIPHYNEEKPDEILNLKYESPIFYNQQWTHQRLFIDNKNETSVYQLTLESAKRNGVDLEIIEDEKFGGKYVKSIEGIRDGDDNRFWEYWVINKDTGEKTIGDKSIDQQTLKKNEFIEWRLANEQEHGCGGGGGQEYEAFVMDYFDKNTPSYLRSTITPNFKINFAY